MKFDQDGIKKFSLWDVKKLINEEAGKGPPKEATYELIGLSFTENYAFDDIPDWGTYYGPFQTGRNQKGYFESPSIKQVTSEMIDYWSMRSQETNNIILKIRYLGLVWDFQEKVSSVKPDYKIGIEYINTIIRFIREDYAEDSYDNVVKAERALSIAVLLNQKDKIAGLIDIIINLEENEKSEFGFALRTLIDSKIVNDQDVENRILKILDKKFSDELEKAESENYPWEIDRMATILATYHRGKGDLNKAKSIIKKSGDVIISISSEENGTQASMYLEHLNKVYGDFQLNDEIPDLLVLLRKKQKEIELTTVSTSYSISAAELSNFIDPLFTDEVKLIIAKIAYRFVPDKEKLEEDLQVINSDPLRMIFSEKNIDGEGRTLANLSPQDKEGELMNQLCSTFQKSGFYLFKTIESLINEDILIGSDFNTMLENSPIIDEDRIGIIKSSIENTIKGEFVIGMSLIIPQLEDAIRNLVEQGDGAILKRKRNGSYQLKTFDEVLRDSTTVQVLGENICFYLRSVLTDQRGLNLRNDLCHGNLSFNSFNPDSAGRVLHCLMLILLVKNESNTDNT